jgi:DNA-binding transcriptional ArsR family regulator
LIHNKAQFSHAAEPRVENCSTIWLTIFIAGAIFNHMVVKYSARRTKIRSGPGSSAGRLDAVFHALSDPTRRQMLRALADGERTVGELAAPFRMSLAGAAKHVKTLERSGLLRRTVQGRTHICRLEPAPLASANGWFRYYTRFWEQSLDALEAALREEDALNERAPRKSKTSASKGPAA